MKKKLFFISIVIVVGGFLLYNYLYRGHRDIAAEKVTYAKTVAEIYKDFEDNDSLANATYLDKTLLVHGKVSNIDISGKIITVDEKLTARFKDNIPENIKLNDSVSIKGRVIGFDDLLEEIKMDQCILE